MKIISFKTLLTITCLIGIQTSWVAFPAKTLKSIEVNRKVKFGDHIGEFFLIVFLPIGIWILQPSAKKIIEKRPLENTESRIANIK